jgi:hypothetical protein
MPQYKLDGDCEFFNRHLQSTTSCPFLPGQQVNILDVPIEEDHSWVHSRNNSATGVMTMDPADKFVSPRRAPTPTALPRINTRDTKEILSSASGSETSISPVSMNPSGINRMFSLRKASVSNENMKPAIPARSASLRGAFRSLRGTTSLLDLREERGRGREHAKSVAGDIGISNPTLLSRLDADRVCIPIATAIERSKSRGSNGHTSENAGRASESFRQRSSSLGSRESSPLRNTVVREPSPSRVTIPDEIAEEEEDEINFIAEYENEAEPTGLMAPPSRRAPLPPADSLRNSPVNNSQTARFKLGATLFDPTDEPMVESRFAGDSEFDPVKPMAHRSLVPAPLSLGKKDVVPTAEPSSHFSVISDASRIFSPKESHFSMGSTTSQCSTSPTDRSSVEPSMYQCSSESISPRDAESDYISEYFNNGDSAESSNISSCSENEDEDARALELAEARVKTSSSHREAKCFGIARFQYALPNEADHASQTTIRKAKTPVLLQGNRATFGGSLGGHGFAPSVSMADDDAVPVGDAHDLFDDLSYLGGLIDNPFGFPDAEV